MNYTNKTFIKRIATPRGFREVFYEYLLEFQSQKDCFDFLNRIYLEKL